MRFWLLEEFSSYAKTGFSWNVMSLWFFVTKASNLAICDFLVKTIKYSSNQNVSYWKELVNALTNVVGFLRVLRFLPARNIAG